MNDPDISLMFRLLIDRVQDYAIFLLDPTGHVKTWNPGARRIKGYEPEEIIGRHFSTFYLPDEKNAKPQKALEIAAREGKYEEEGWRVRKDGSLFWASVLIIPLFENEELRGFAKITRDMTAHKESEERLQNALREAEAANRIKDEFLTTVSHELRTPLTAILGWATLLTLGDRTPESTEVALQSIEENARLQARLVDDLLDVSRLTSGLLRVAFTELDLDLLLLQAIDSIHPTAQAKGIAVTHELPEERLLISGDPTRMHQICWNILSNAVKFTDSGGSVHVRCFPEQHFVVIEVSDTGRGIDAAFLPHVFDRFSQGDSSFTRADSGLGIGLAIAKQLVEVHGGSIDASSPGAGAGSTFRVRLPILSREKRVPQRAGEPAAKLPSLAGVHILIVEDDIHTRTFLQALVEQFGAHVTPASSVTEAVVELQQRKPDAVISDISLPGEDGFSFIQKLRTMAPDMPAVAVTAVYVAPEDRHRLLAAGFDDYLRKPVLPIELAERVRLLLDRKPRV